MKALGNALDRWELMANDTKGYLEVLEPEFCTAMDALYRAMQNNASNGFTDAVKGI